MFLPCSSHVPPLGVFRGWGAEAQGERGLEGLAGMGAVLAGGWLKVKVENVVGMGGFEFRV
jgi:hypothetical protein